MKKTLQKFLTILLSLTLVSAVFSSAVFTAASAEEQTPKYFMLEDFENILDWVSQHPDSTLSLDSSKKTQGYSSMRSRLSPEAAVRSDQILLLYEAMDIMDFTDYDYFEFDLMLDKVAEFVSPKNELVMQLNVIDPNSGGQDGFNHLLVMSGADTIANQWRTVQCALQKTNPVVGNTSITHISKIRIAFFNVTEPMKVEELNLNFDRLMFYNSAFKTARDQAQVDVQGMVSQLSVPTQENYKQLETQILAAETAYKEMNTNYPGAKIENQATYDSVVSAYYSFAKADMIANTEALITAIGDVTIENYTDKKLPIEAAEAAVAELTTLYGEDTKPSNIDILTAARTKYNDIEAAAPVITAIEAIPAVDSLTSDDADTVNNTKTAYDGLTSDQKAYVPADDVTKLDAAVERIYEILHPYTLGDVDENGDVSASDALLALQHSVKKITLTDNRFLAADVDKNGDVTAGDALLILQYAVEKISEWPNS